MLLTFETQIMAITASESTLGFLIITTSLFHLAAVNCWTEHKYIKIQLNTEIQS